MDTCIIYIAESLFSAPETITTLLVGYESESHSIVSNSATPWTIRSMEFSRPEFWSREPFPSPGDLPDLVLEPRSPALQADSLPAEPPGWL